MQEPAPVVWMENLGARKRRERAGSVERNSLQRLSSELAGVPTCAALRRGRAASVSDENIERVALGCGIRGSAVISLILPHRLAAHKSVGPLAETPTHGGSHIAIHSVPTAAHPRHPPPLSEMCITLTRAPLRSLYVRRSRSKHEIRRCRRWLDVSLPGFVSERFDLFDRTTPDESQWYGPVNTLLAYLFPLQEYEIAPQYKGPVYPGSIDFTTLYIVRSARGNTKHPICFIEIKPAGHLQEMAARGAADRQMRDSVEHLVEALIIPKLIGLSAMGSRFAVYEYDQASRKLTPPEIARDRAFVNDTAPAERWAHDFLDAGAGEAKLLEVVQSIRGSDDAACTRPRPSVNETGCVEC
ncbi:hypothetical protein B0H11DRAFT_2280223 [Mycena galericulata]|nr:hypothetical protein B0H11DRAFT_2280223 [Mycena galericulata]